MLEALVVLIERASEGAIGSILLVDRAQGTVRRGAAPRLAEAFTRAIDGEAIGPTAGSCGAAAFLKQRVVASDIATHPNWTTYKELALSNGLAACWSTPILGSSGNVLGTVAVYYETARTPVAGDFDGVDVATHLAAIAIERELANARIAHQSALLDRAHDAIIVLGLDDRVQYWSKGATRLYGHTTEAALGRAFGELVTTQGGVREVLIERLLVEGDSTAELHRRTAAGHVRIVESSATLLRDESGAPCAFLIIDTDITERKLMEAQFHRAQRIESLGTLAGGVAHDFNNILTGILGHSRAARKALPEGHAARLSLAEVDKAAWRAADLTRRILAFSRRTDSTRSPIDLRAPLTEALALLRATIPPPIVIRSRFSEEEAAIALADPTSVHQIMMNLGTNAAYAIGNQSGHVDIELDEITVALARPLIAATLQPGTYFRLTVRDDGAGMSASTLERMFEPYFTTKSAVGTGLGLSVVHGIVASHGGAIDAASTEGIGTTFHVYLPTLARRSIAASPAVVEEVEPRGHGERILFVDDEEAVVALAGDALVELGYRIDVFTDPVRALAAFRSAADDYDLLVTDSAMHGITGHELIRGVRERRPTLPIIVISGRVRPSDREALEALHVDEILPKPLVFDRIAGALQRALAARA